MKIINAAVPIILLIASIVFCVLAFIGHAGATPAAAACSSAAIICNVGLKNKNKTK